MVAPLVIGIMEVPLGDGVSVGIGKDENSDLLRVKESTGEACMAGDTVEPQAAAKWEAALKEEGSEVQRMTANTEAPLRQGNREDTAWEGDLDRPPAGEVSVQGREKEKGEGQAMRCFADRPLQVSAFSTSPADRYDCFWVKS